jgi:hypothetical protein
MSALCRAGDVYWDIVEVVRMILRDEAGVEVLVMGDGAPVVGVLSCTILVAEIFEVLVLFIVCGVIGAFWGFVRGPVLL